MCILASLFPCHNQCIDNQCIILWSFWSLSYRKLVKDSFPYPSDLQAREKGCGVWCKAWFFIALLKNKRDTLFAAQISCEGLNENVLNSLTTLNTWSLVPVIVWECLEGGMSLLEEVCHWEWGRVCHLRLKSLWHFSAHSLCFVQVLHDVSFQLPFLLLCLLPCHKHRKPWAPIKAFFYELWSWFFFLPPLEK